LQTIYDLAIIGGGIVGCATALALTETFPGAHLALFEKEPHLAAHQTGHNSGVVHAGLYYRPGSLKAQTCTTGREALYRFCQEHDIPHERCGKVVVAVDVEELPALDELERRGVENGLDGLRRLDADGVRRHEPHVQGIAGLFVPQTGIVDFVRVTEVMAGIVRARKGEIHLGTPVTKISRAAKIYQIRSGQETYHARCVVNCTGLHADRTARMAGIRPELRIIPFRGEYYAFKSEHRSLVKNLIYPVPNPEMPFLGVHFTRMIDGVVEAGPNAVLAMKREGYGRADISLRDLVDTLAFRGFWKLAARYWRVGLYEYQRSFSKRLFVRSLQRLIPGVCADYLEAGGSGVRAQAVDRDGRMVDDFQIVRDGCMVHVLNAPSPAATASLSIGCHIADQVAKLL
jgi:L-2-hydroxyglutarate oxidase